MLLWALLPVVHAASVIVSVYPQETATTTANVYYVTVTTGGSSSSSSSTITSATGQTTAVTSCHFHGTTQYCYDGNGSEGYMVGVTNTESAVSSYTGCHAHDATETYCLDSDGDEVQYVVEASNSTTTTSSSGSNCHYHAGVEHCTGDDESEETCERTDRDYNIPLRIGLLFVIFVTSSIGSFGPLVLRKLLNLSFDGIVFVIMKQFGTGIIISTAFVHLITHAELMWSSSCMGELSYEATGTSITMAGLFLAFLVEYVAHRLISSSKSETVTPTKTEEEVASSAEDVEKQPEHISTSSHTHDPANVNSHVSVLTMEMGIIFHSILIGITLVVAGDSFFITLFIVIVFHQLFEGLALGSRIAQLDSTIIRKVIMALSFGLVTPIGMAIGIGVLSKFNGNDKSTLIALGTLDSFSAGVLLWTGIVEMWAMDWLFGSLAHAGAVKTSVAMVSLVLGMLLMSVLGKWA